MVEYSTMSATDNMLVLVKGLISICEKEVQDAIDLRNLIWKNMDSYWTPAEGHKFSLRSTKEKWADFLLIAQSGQRSSMAEKAKLEYFQLECQVVGDLKKFNAE